VYRQAVSISLHGFLADCEMMEKEKSEGYKSPKA